MIKLSVNINKIATIRNARGGVTPNVVEAAINCQKFGSDGVTIHPRPDERHITRKDVYDIKPIISTEFNIEGYPSKDFINMVLEVNPEQVTLVPDGPDVITSCAGWDTVKFQDYLKEIISIFKEKGIRTSVFVDPKIEMIEGAKKCGTDRIELYTEDYATNYLSNKEKAIAPYVEAAKKATELGLGINAGHDLSLENLEYFAKEIPNLAEVSIGHALISDALYLGLENAIQMYKRLL
ncbi:MAG: pyridoxine 5'-phosphate synthase [Flavobacteriales bacterium]|jgi:pyridoxine 5-phosphate synthase|nr:pyridoxine 5'-phosphate synthase [Flavobacteriales bacterium]MBT5354897.1 pyridoxine 5'-phosphate synthase [Flavobacteriales bacterium]MBT5699122.1 pyridoxine 5'-phosphate synthase [Flavobacteriales bacterium]MBT7620455.1 pyridoxine 5'-phosphate synthase [Flavobacteriales bacterium]